MSTSTPTSKSIAPLSIERGFREAAVYWYPAVLDSIVALRAAIVSSGVSIVAAIFVVPSGPLAGWLGLVTLVVSWAYSMPPIRLLDTGFGEVVTSVTVAGLVPVIGATAMGGGVPEELWWSMGFLVPIHMAMMLAFELPDLVSDAAVGKRVLAVRIGAAKTRRLIVGLLAAAALVGGLAGLAGRLPGGVVAIFVSAVPASVLLRSMSKQDHRATTLAAVATLASTAATLAVLGLG